MADDNTTEDEFEEAELTEELDEELDEDELAEEDLEENLNDEEALVEETDGAEAAPEAAETTARSRRKARDDEEEVDEEEVDPDDVEADLDKILKDRIAATDDELEDEDEEVDDKRTGGEGAEGVAPKKANEFTCPGCFLLVSAAQFGKSDNPRCPVGEDPCPAIPMLKKGRRR
jgi:hypothetical protein